MWWPTPLYSVLVCGHPLDCVGKSEPKPDCQVASIENDTQWFGMQGAYDSLRSKRSSGLAFPFTFPRGFGG
eukprot:scaffold37158_cov52-Prasinocladus_malaysianus.AAC.5